MAKKSPTKLVKSTKLEIQYSEIIKQIQTTVIPLPDNASLAQPSPYKVLPTVVTYGAYEEPILGQ